MAIAQGERMRRQEIGNILSAFIMGQDFRKTAEFVTSLLSAEQTP